MTSSRESPSTHVGWLLSGGGPQSSPCFMEREQAYVHITIQSGMCLSDATGVWCIIHVVFVVWHLVWTVKTASSGLHSYGFL